MKYLLLSLLLLNCTPGEKPEPQPEITLPLEQECFCQVPQKKEPAPDIKQYSYVLGEAETFFDFHDQNENRSVNIEFAVNKIKQEKEYIILKPDEIFSYNSLVGIRSEENGFLDAPIIFNGELIDGIGGGVCQVSSTIFAASVYAGLKIVERAAHSRPSTYIGKGLDAVVVSCSQSNQPCFDQDLKIQNIYNFPVILKLDILIKNINNRQKKALKVSFLAERAGKNIKTKWVSLKFFDFEKEIKEVSYASTNWKRRRQAGSKGVKGYLEVEDLTENKKNYIFSHYRPVNEIWEVGRKQ